MAAVRRLFLVAILLPGSAHAAIIGSDAAACVARDGPAIQVQVTGLKDRRGELKLELYPANDADFLKDDRDLIAQGKTFRRVRVPTPPAGNVTMCIKVPAPGSYGLLFTHNRDGKNKFNFWSDGAGVSSNQRLGRSRPKVGMSTVAVGRGVTNVTIRAQYIRGVIPSFGFIG